MLSIAKYLKVGLKVRKLRKLHVWKTKSQQELKCLLSLSDCKGEENDKLRVEIKRKVQEEKIINIRIFLYLHKLWFTQGNCIVAGHLAALPLLTQSATEPRATQTRGKQSHKLRSIQTKVLPEGFRHDKLKLCMKSHGEREQDRRILSQCFIFSIKPTCVQRVGTKPACNTDIY